MFRRSITPQLAREVMENHKSMHSAENLIKYLFETLQFSAVDL